MANGTQRRAQRVWVIALVFAVHALVCLVLMRPGRIVRVVPKSTSLSLIYLSPRQAGAEAIRIVPLPPVSPLPPASPSPRARVDKPQSVAPIDNGSGEESNAIHAPIDWADEMTRAAEDFSAEPSAPKPREFGAPHVGPEPQAKHPEFGWKRSRTNRLERVTEGTAVHLGEHCVMTVTPLPVVSCTPGKKRANGDLFEHMRDPQDGDGGKLP